MNIIIRSLFLLFYVANAGAYQIGQVRSEPVMEARCIDALTPRKSPTVSLRDQKEVMIVSWNVENVLAKRGKFEYSGLDQSTGTYRYSARHRSDRSEERWKFEEKQNKFISAGRHLGVEGLPHFIVAPEVEGRRAGLKLLDTGPLEDQYRLFMTQGNDPRGIEIALAVRADLKVDVEMESHRSMTWVDKFESDIARVFSRDVPALIVRDEDDGKVLLVLLGKHAKSRRNRDGDRESKALRAAQCEATREIIRSYQQRFGAEVPVILAGDFNAPVNIAREVDPVKEVVHDSFDVLNVLDRATSSYHPDHRATVYNQLDAIMVSPSLVPYLRRAMVLPEFDPLTGRVLGRPRSFKDRQDNYPSDHRAIGVVIHGQAWAGLP